MSSTSDAGTLLLRVRLIGGETTERQLVGVAEATKVVGDAAEETGGKEAFAAEKSFLFGESMYSLRRYAFYALTAIGATGAGILKMGYSFDEARTRGVGALTALTGSASTARSEVSQLVDLTHTTGLGLSSLVNATQTMVTFGFSVRDTNAYLKAFASYAGRMGTGASGVSALTSIFNSIKAAGFMNAKELKSLEALGIPGPQIMSQALGLSPATQQLLLEGKYVVGAGTALPDIASWLQGYSNKLPTTLSQQWAILHSYLSSITGAIGQPVFNWIDQLAPKLNAALGRLSAAGSTGGIVGVLRALDPSQTLLHAWDTFANVIRLAWGSLQTLWGIASPFVKLFAGIASVALAVTAHLRGLSTVAKILGAVYFVHLALELGKAGKAMKVFAAAQAFAGTMMKVWRFGVVAVNAALLVMRSEMTLLEGTMVILNLLDPFTWVVIAAAGFALLYWKVRAVRVAVADVWSWVKANWPTLKATFVEPFVGAYVSVTRIWDALKAVWAWISAHTFTIHFSLGGSSFLDRLVKGTLEAGIPGWSQLRDIASLAGVVDGSGHTASLSRAQLVAQQGVLGQTAGVTKLAQMDATAGVTPTQLEQQGWTPNSALVQALTRDIQINLSMDGRTIAHAVVKHSDLVGGAAAKATLKAQARR